MAGSEFERPQGPGRLIPPAQLEQMLKQRAELMRVCAIMVDRLGGEVRIGPSDLEDDRILSRSTIGITGVVVYKTEKPH